MIASQPLTQLVKKIGNRLKDPDRAAQILLHPSNRNEDPLFPEQLSHHLSDNLLEEYRGVLLLLSELDRLFPDEQWDAAVHAYVLKMKEIIEKKGVFSLSLFGGIAGIAFALQRASRGGSRYQRMAASLEEEILRSADKDYLIPLEGNFKAGQPSSSSLYDLMQGVTGIGVYCLNNLRNPSFAKLAERIARALVHLSKPLEAEGLTVPGWYVPSRYLFLKEDQEKYLKGNFNLGLSHGIPGPLAYLSAAALRGVEAEGQKEAIQTMADWIKRHRQEEQGNLFWGSYVSFEEETEGLRRTSKRKSGWCYGTAGVARSLFLAGKALGSEELKTFAADSFSSVFVLSPQEWNLSSPTFCHGIAGLLLTTWTFYEDTRSPFFEQQAERLKEILLGYYHEDYPFGFKNRDSCSKGGFVEISQLGLLEGVSGILLTLLSLEAPSTGWHVPFLISEGKQ